MSFRHTYRSQGGGTSNQDDRWSSFKRDRFNQKNRNTSVDMNVNRNVGYNGSWNYDTSHYLLGKFSVQNNYKANSSYFPSSVPSYKRRKFCAGSWGDGGRYHPQQPDVHENGEFAAYKNEVLPPSRSNAEASMSMNSKRDHSQLEDEEPVFMSRDEIDRYSPSRKDGIDALHEMHLRYSYCAFLQNLGGCLNLPQTTTGTAMVLCHRFFVRRSHACHDRYLIATAALFLAAKSEETARPLNDVLRASCEIFHKRDSSFLSFVLPVDWFEKYRERIIEAEQMILTTLNFELNVQHPYAPLTSILDKLGLSQSLLVNLALNLISEGLWSSLWLQFEPHHIAAGAAYLAAKFMNLDLASYHNIWHEFQTTPAILQDVAQQLMELF